MSTSNAVTQTMERAAGTTFGLDSVTAYLQSRRAGLDAQLVRRLVAFLDGAHESLDCAIYDLRHPAMACRSIARGGWPSREACAEETLFVHNENSRLATAWE